MILRPHGEFCKNAGKTSKINLEMTGKDDMDSRKYDLTQGNILSRLLLVALPLMGTQLMTMAYNLTDMFWLGRIGRDAVAATGTAGMYIWLSIAFMHIGRMGAEIGVSQYIGKGDRLGARSFSQNAIFLAALCGIGYALFIIGLRYPLIGFFNIYETAVAEGAKLYLKVVAFGMPFAFVNDAVSGTFNGSGNSRVPFIINGAALAINMILSPLFIFVLDMGIAGAALATVIAQSLAMTASLITLRFSSIRPFDDMRLIHKPDLIRIKQIFRWVAPITTESAAFTFLSMFVARFIAAFGADAIAVQRIGIQIESISWLIAGGFGSALTAFIGQNYGRGCYDRIRKGAILGMRTMILWGIVATAIPLIFGRQLFWIFIQDEAVVEEGIRFLRILSVSQVLICLEFWAVGVFRGLGKTIPPSITTITGNALRIPLSWFLSQTALGLAGLWWGLAIGACLRGITLTIWYHVHARKFPKEKETVTT